MRIVLSPQAEKQLKKLAKIDQIAVARKIRALRDDKISRNPKLKGFKNIFRVRVGDLRIVFKKTRQEIYIILIRHQKDVYKLIKRLFY
jgi:mRNA interferase RelE/StbE